MQGFNIIICIMEKIYIPLLSDTYVPGGLKPNSVQMFLLIFIYLVALKIREKCEKLVCLHVCEGRVIYIVPIIHYMLFSYQTGYIM
jgi:hypothetical protein